MKLLAGFLGYFLILSPASDAQAGSVEWRIVNNFRAIDGDTEQTRYLDELHNYVCWSSRKQRAQGCKQKEIRSPSGLMAPTKTDYRPVWQEPIYSYGVSYVGEKKRTLTATLKGGFKTCEWFIDGNEQDAKGCQCPSEQFAYAQRREHEHHDEGYGDGELLHVAHLAH